MLAIIIGFIIGLLVPVQTSVNTRLRGVVGSPFLASLISFSIGSSCSSMGILQVSQLLPMNRSGFGVEGCSVSFI